MGLTSCAEYKGTDKADHRTERCDGLHDDFQGTFCHLLGTNPFTIFVVSCSFHKTELEAGNKKVVSSRKRPDEEVTNHLD